MSALLEKVRSEPVLVTALVGAVLYLLTEFGVQVTDGQQAAILGVIGAVLAFVARARVKPLAADEPRRPARDAGAVDTGTAVVLVLLVLLILIVAGVI